MLDDIKVTLLSKEEYFGSDKKSVFKRNSQLDVIKRYGKKIYDSDLVKLTGGAKYGESDSWTRTKGNDNKVVSIYDGYEASELDSQRMDGVIRPVLKLPTKVDKLFSSKIEHYTSIIYDDYYYIYLGEYPQILLPSYNDLKRYYAENKLEKTGRIFHINNQICEEYKDIKGDKYIRYKVEKNTYIHRKYEIPEGEYVWVKVMPVSWLIDNKTNLLVSEHNLLAGVRFNKGGYDGNFENTEMYDFLNNVMFRDIFQDYLPKKEETKEENKDTILNWIKELLKKSEEIKDENDKENIAKDLIALAKLYSDELIKIREKEPNKYGDERNLIAGIMPYYVYIDGEIKREINEDNKDKEMMEINKAIDNLIERANLIEDEDIKLDILRKIEELKTNYLEELNTSKNSYERVDFSKPLEKHKDSNGKEYMKYIEKLTLKPTRPILIKELMAKEMAISKRIDKELASNNIRGELSEIEKHADEIMKR